MSEPLKPGICGVCDQSVIWFKSKQTGRIIFTDMYCEISLALSDGTVATHAVCSKCKRTLTDQKIADLFERIRASWSDSMVGWASDEQFNQLRNNAVDAWDNSGDHEKRIVEKQEKVKEQKHQEKLEAKRAKDKGGKRES